MNAGIICTGDELLEGLVQEQNLSYIARELSDLGYRITEATITRDNITQIDETLERFRKSCSLLVITGGLGPTFDDVTMDAMSITTGVSLEEDHLYLRELHGRFSSRFGRVAPDGLKRQARVMPGSIPIENPSGSARGVFYRTGCGTEYLVMPGPPNEMREVFSNAMKLVTKPENALETRIIGFTGTTEAEINPFLEELHRQMPGINMITRAEHVIGPTVSLSSRREEREILESAVSIIEKEFGPSVYTTRGESFLDLLVARLLDSGLTVSVAESCTGGTLSSALTSVPGVSGTFTGGVIAYSNESKYSILGISPGLVEKHGAVSKQCAAAMSERVSDLFLTDIGLSVTGIAGPTGATAEKPVGLVFSSLHADNRSEVYEAVYSGTRQSIMTKASYDLLKRLWKVLSEL